MSASHDSHPRVLDPARLSWAGGVPRSVDYGDIYFSTRNGVEESQAIFLAGNHLPERWRAETAPDDNDFRIVELGFGTGLNFLIARAAFLATAPIDRCLDYASFEAHPLAADDRAHLAATFMGTHPELARGLVQLNMIDPPRLRGWHRRCLDHGRVRLSLYYGNADEGLADWQASSGIPAQGGGADAWFLDGFAPHCNPELWTPSLCARLHALSRPGATLATFSVAGSVRAALTAAGFEVEQVPGPAGKRLVLEGHLRADGAARLSSRLSGLSDRSEPSGKTRTDSNEFEAHSAAVQRKNRANMDRFPAGAVDRSQVRQAARQRHRARPRTAHVIGAGLAGATCAAALRARGLDVCLHDPSGVAAGASANPWAVLHPRLPLDDGPRGPFFALAYGFALHWIDGLGEASGWQPRRVLQLPEIRRPDRLLRVLARYEACGRWLQAEELGGLTGIAFPDGGHANLPQLIQRVLSNAGIDVVRDIHTQAILALRHGPDGWRLQHATGQSAAADVVVVAAGADSARLLPGAPPLGRMRGQIDRTRGHLSAEVVGLPIVTGRGHALALADGWVCGASYQRDGDAGDPSREEREANLERLAHLQELLQIETGAAEPTRPTEEARETFVGVRCTVPDRAPLIGAAPGPPGLWVSTGHASAGLLTCPLGAEAIAAAICREPPVLDREMWRMLDPGRFRALSPRSCGR